MDELIRQHGTAIVAILWFIILSMGGFITFFLKNDRKSFMEKLEKNTKDIEIVKQTISDKVDILEDEMEDVKTNYNLKFEKIYAKQDQMKTSINNNHIAMMTAIHNVDIKIEKLNGNK